MKEDEILEVTYHFLLKLLALEHNSKEVQDSEDALQAEIC